jgi:UrcA family protein
MKTFAIRLAPAAVLLVATLAGSPASARDLSLSYTKSDLANSAAISALYERIEKKATSACALYENSGLFGVEYQRACAAPLIEELVSGIDHPTLSALHHERNTGRFAQSQ